MLDLFPVEELDQHQQDQGNGGDTDVERVLSCEKRVKDWRVGTKELVDRARDDLRGNASPCLLSSSCASYSCSLVICRYRTRLQISLDFIN